VGFSSRRIAVVGASALALLAVPGAARAADAPGAPGDVATWTEGDKDGMGTATSTASRAWMTLDDGELTEVYAPDLSTPSLRDLQLVVTDGKSFAEREREDATHRIVLRDPRSLTYRQVNTDRSGRWRITKTYVTDPRRSAVLVKVRFESLTGRPYKLYALLDPALSNTGNDDVGETRGHALVARDDTLASALVSKPAATRVSSGYLGKSDGWTDLRDDFRMDWTYARAAAKGNVAQIAELPVTGRPGHRRATLALGFGASAGAASSTAGAALRGGFRTAARRYAAGWHAYLGRLPRPRSAAGHRRLYDVSAMVLAGLEDKTYRGAGIASPSMAWVWGTLEDSGPYHLVWSRDLYQVATAQIAAGDRAAAGRSLDYLWTHQQAADGCLPQNTRVDGRPYWTGLQLDEVADPILLASQLGRSDPETWRHVERAAACILAQGPTSQERWENTDDWYSPATIAAEIAALVCAADIADRNGAAAAAGSYRAVADEWQRNVAHWTRTTNGPLSPQPYYLRVTTDGNADAGTQYTIGDGGPTIDQRRVVDTSFLELVRLGVKRADDPDIRSTLPVVDRELGVTTPNGQFWHRYNFDGYGETADGSPFPGDGNRGRLWPLLAGERGEYELATGDRRAAAKRLDSIAATASPGEMLPEQVWDDQPPPGATPGTGTLSATPLAWTHAQFIRLAWSIDAGGPVEQPRAVACRYAQRCR
jgi:glucoamylase